MQSGGFAKGQAELKAAERDRKSQWQDLSDLGVCGPGENCPFGKHKDISGNIPLHTSVYSTEDGFQICAHMYTLSFFFLNRTLYMCVCIHIYMDLPVGSDSKGPPAMWETWVRSLDWEDPLEEGMATHSRIFALRIPRMEEPGELQSMGSQRVGHD